MPATVALDTSFVIGLLDGQDVWHRATLQLQAGLVENSYQPVLFDCVLAEVISTLARRLQERRRAAEFTPLLQQIKAQFPPGAIAWVLPDMPRLYGDVLNLVEQTQGALNFNDALIAISCQKRRIANLASFDADFDQVPWLRRLAHPGDIVSQP
jgi:predicted nucleic acid-binding protein